MYGKGRKVFRQDDTLITNMLRPSGEVSSEPPKWAGSINSHWSRSWARRPSASNSLVQEWVRGYMPCFSEFGLVPSRAFVAKRMLNCKSTAPGPDLIPFLAWKQIAP